MSTDFYINDLELEAGLERSVDGLVSRTSSSGWHQDGRDNQDCGHRHNDEYVDLSIFEQMSDIAVLNTKNTLGNTNHLNVEERLGHSDDAADENLTASDVDGGSLWQDADQEIQARFVAESTYHHHDQKQFVVDSSSDCYMLHS